MGQFSTESNISKRIEGNSLSKEELILKAQTEQWIFDVWKKAEIEKRLQEAFANSKSHAKTLSEL